MGFAEPQLLKGCSRDLLVISDASHDSSFLMLGRNRTVIAAANAACHCSPSFLCWAIARVLQLSEIHRAPCVSPQDQSGCHRYAVITSSCFLVGCYCDNLYSHCITGWPDNTNAAKRAVSATHLSWGMCA